MPDDNGARVDTGPALGGFDSPKAAGALVIGALAFLILVHRAFRTRNGG